MAMGVEEALSEMHFGEAEEAEGCVVIEGDEDEEADLPEWSCAYCGVHSAASVVRCVNTGKWFCNARHRGIPASCAVQHLVRSRHKEVSLHPESPLGEMILECYITGNRNVFQLGFVSMKAENTVVLLSRELLLGNEAGAHAKTIQDMNLDLKQWEPLIRDKQFLPWLVTVPGEGEILRAKQITSEQVIKLEDMWRKDPNAILESVDGPGIEDEAVPVQLRYDNAIAYQNTYAALINLEADYDKTMKESHAKDGIMIRWETSLSKKKLAFFRFPKDESMLKLAIGDEIKIDHPATSLGAKPFSAVAFVVRFTEAEEVGVELQQTKGVPTDVTGGYSVELVWKSTSFDRMKYALKALAVDKRAMSTFLYVKLLGIERAAPPTQIAMPKRLTAPNLPELNYSQTQAVQKVLESPLSLIQGPPGTGKTVTSATIVYFLSKFGKGQVLVCAPSNVAVDQLAEKIDATGLKVVRLCAKSREATQSTFETEHLSLHNQVREYALLGKPDLAQLFKKLDKQGDLSAQDDKKFRSLRRSVEKDILQGADVVCCTCVGAGDPRLSSFKFRQVLIDESTQASEPETLIPIVLGAKQLVLVGDHCQLGPVIMCKKAGRAGLGQSLFERLVALGERPIRLTVQYRMHPCLSEFPSNTYYDGTLQNGVTIEERQYKNIKDFPWPHPQRPMFFYTQSGTEEMSSSGTSYLNRTEASNVEKIVTMFLKTGMSPQQIGVITPYEGQRAYIVSHMARAGSMRQALYEEIEVASVDSFQGREKDFIILSCVRANDHSGIGFLADPRRLNVALTRARYGLIVLGNIKMLSKPPLWNSLLNHFKYYDAIVEGPLNNLKQSRVTFRRYLRPFVYKALPAYGVPLDVDDDDASVISEQSTRTQEMGRAPRFQRNYDDLWSAIPAMPFAPVPFAPMGNFMGDMYSIPPDMQSMHVPGPQQGAGRGFGAGRGAGQMQDDKTRQGGGPIGQQPMGC